MRKNKYKKYYYNDVKKIILDLIFVNSRTLFFNSKIGFFSLGKGYSLNTYSKKD
jgi:hypothetical protein